jgi:O-antigen ligase
MVNAASRISAVSYVVSVSTTLFLLRKYKYIPLAAIITLIFAFSTSNLFDRYLNIFNVVKEKLSSLIPTAYARYNDSNVLAATTSIEDRSTSIRLNIEWPRAIRAFLKNSLLGTGYSSITLATDNDYLRTLGEIGILGFVSTFFVHFRIIKELIIKSWPKGILSKKEINFRTAYLAGVLGCLPGIFMNALFIDVFEASKFAIPFWIIIGLGVACLYEKNIKKA